MWVSAFPERITTQRLLLRRWVLTDAAALKDAIDSSLAELQAWMAWAMAEPSPLAVIEERMVRFRGDFDTGREWLYGIFTDGGAQLAGGVGIHPRADADALEMGYWLRTSATGNGYASEAAAALATAAFAATNTAHIEIRCDPRNLRSAAIPRRLGYRLRETLIANTVTPSGGPRDTMVWVLSRGDQTRTGY
jgi:RimJ/RimL family protein N-acetyltransferase